MDEESFALWIRRHRERVSWTQSRLANELGYSTDAIYAWEKGVRTPHLDEKLINKISTIFGVSEKEINRVLITSSPKKNKLLQNNLMIPFKNQDSCEKDIIDAASQARRVRILTIRAEKYFVGSKGILIDSLCEGERAKDITTQVMILSAQARHITEELAEKHGRSEEKMRQKMLDAHPYLKRYTSNEKLNFEVRCYGKTPNFKILIFDDVMFVTAYVNRKNDSNTRMFKFMREGNPLFTGFERLFDELWESSIPLV